MLALRGWRTLCVRQRLPSFPGFTLVNYEGDNISKYVYLSVKDTALEKPCKKFFIANFIVLLIGLPSDGTIWTVFILIFVS